MAYGKESYFKFYTDRFDIQLTHIFICVCLLKSSVMEHKTTCDANWLFLNSSPCSICMSSVPHST